MKRSTLLGLTIISCIGVIFAVIVSDESEPTENNVVEEQISEFEIDQQRMDELQLQYNEIIEYTCAGAMESRPQSYFEVVIEERIFEVEHRLQYLSDQQSEFQNIKNEIQILNENNLELDNEPFVLWEWECVNQKYWIEEYPHLLEILAKR